MAIAYSALVNGGTVVRPHLGKAIEDGNGRLVAGAPQAGTPQGQVRRRTTAGDHATACARPPSEPGGTSADVFKGFPYTVYGKTGTAERTPTPTSRGTSCYVNDAAQPIVVVMTVERGGFGAETAAPAARLILSHWFGLKDGSFTPGSDQTR